MFKFRRPIFAVALALSGLTLSSCSKDDPKPETTITAQQQQLATGSWRLDEIWEGGRMTNSNNDIKDRYSLTFRTNGTYTQTLLADNTTYNGTWTLTGTNNTLRLVDHKGTANEYAITSLTAAALRYSFQSKAGFPAENVFSAQP